jgi:dihydroorotase
MSLLVRQAKVIDSTSPYNGSIVDILVDGGVVKDIAPTLEVDERNFSKENIVRAEEGNTLNISPGWVDCFADYREPGYEQKETIATGLAAAAAGGYTDVMLVPNTQPVTDGRAGIQYLLQRAQGNAVRLHPMGAVSQGIEGKALAEMMDMRAHGAAAFTDGWKPVQSSALLLKALEYVKAFGGVVVELPMDAALSAGGLMHEGAMSTRLGMPGIPTLAESLIVHRDLELARYAGSRLHITGVSTAESINLIWMAKNEGVDVTCSVTPYHLLLTDADLQTYDSGYKVSPPLRTEADRQALIAALADGTVDCIASHHRPQDWDAKAKEFEYAGEGMAIQEIAFSLVSTAVGKEVSLERLVDAMGAAPRRIFGLPEVSLQKGSALRATIFSAEEPFTFLKERSASLSVNNPFVGKPLKGKVHRIITAIS